MEVPRPEVKLELTPLARGTATATWGPNCITTYTTAARGNAGSLTHWARPGIEPASSWILVGFISTLPQGELRKTYL